mmetsp:Transcript_1737/g.3802  ORF Transcript_1737/g.3802 Transcript_1737/m.3802 type:complete len:112 (+) Transcript_1737:826-1161(+)
MLRSVLFTFLRVIFLLLGGARELVSSMLSTLGLQDCSLYFPACNLFLLTGTQELIASIFPSLGLQDSSLPSPSRKVPKRHKGRPCSLLGPVACLCCTYEIKAIVVFLGCSR